MLLSFGLLAGLILAPYGKSLGQWIGEGQSVVPQSLNATLLESNDTIGFDVNLTNSSSPIGNDTLAILQNNTVDFNSTGSFTGKEETTIKSYYWAIIFTILGTILLDFNADNIQSPSRAYLLDMCIQEDHGGALSTFSMMAGFYQSFFLMTSAYCF